MEGDIKVSFYNSCRSKKEERVSLFGLFSRIKHGDFKDLIEQLRSFKTKEERNRFKTTKIPAFTYSVNCNGNHSQEHINEYFGVIGLDYDDVGDPVLLKEKAMQIDTTTAAFISPSGNGVKVFVNTNSNKNQHRQAFNIVNSYYNDIVGYESDTSVKDPTRLCFVSYDPDIYINEKSKVFDINEALKLTKEDSIECIFKSTMLGFSEGNRHNVLVSCAGKANRIGIDKQEVINFFNSYADNSFTMHEITYQVYDIYNRYSHQFNTAIHPSTINDEWLNYDFNSKTKNEFVLNNLSRDIAIHEHTGNVFKLSDGVIDFSCKLNFSDFVMKLEDCGLKKSDSAFKRLIKSESIKKITSFNLFLQRVLGNPWDGKDRISEVLKAANLKGEFDQNLDLFTRWLCTAYSYAMRGIDSDIHYNEFSRVVLILYSQQRGVGKTTFFQKLGMSGDIKKKTGVNGLDIYTEFAGSLSKDDRELCLLMESKMIIQIDDIDNALINDNGTLRSIVSKNISDNRVLFTDTIAYKDWRGVLCGSTNHKDLLRNKDENRYLIFESEGVMYFELLNSIDFIQLWSQIRHLCLKDNDLLVFEGEYLETVRKLSQEYVYTSVDDEVISDFLEFDPDGRMSFKEIEDYIDSCNININRSNLGTTLKKLAPNNEPIKVKVNGSFKYRVKIKHEPEEVEPVVLDF